MSVKESNDCMVMIYNSKMYTQCFISSWIGHDMNVSFGKKHQKICNIVSIFLVFLILSDLNNE